MNKIRLAVVAGLAATLITPMVLTTPAHAAPVGTAINLIGPKYGDYGTTAKLTGTLWRHPGGTRIPNALVQLQRSVHGKNVWGVLKSTRTSATGTYAFGITLNGAFDYRAHFPGSASFKPATSARLYPLVRRRVFFDAIRTTNPGEGSGAGILTVNGRIYPALPRGAAFYLQRLSGNTWRNIATGRSTGSLSVAVNGRVGGSITKYRLAAPSSYPYIGGVSRAVNFAHYTWRGVFRKPILASGGVGASYYIFTPQEDADRATNLLRGLADSYSWIEANTSGCLSLIHVAGNVTDQIGQARTNIYVAIRNGNTSLRAARLVPGQSVTWGDIPLNGLVRTRIFLHDGPGVGQPQSIHATYARCSN